MTHAPRYAMSFDLRNRRDSATRSRIAGLRVTPEETVALLARDDASYGDTAASLRQSSWGRPAIASSTAAPAPSAAAAWTPTGACSPAWASVAGADGGFAGKTGYNIPGFSRNPGMSAKASR